MIFTYQPSLENRVDQLEPTLIAEQYCMSRFKIVWMDVIVFCLHGNFLGQDL